MTPTCARTVRVAAVRAVATHDVMTPARAARVGAMRATRATVMHTARIAGVPALRARTSAFRIRSCRATLVASLRPLDTHAPLSPLLRHRRSLSFAALARTRIHHLDTREMSHEGRLADDPP
jgi:hypothetical protein